MFTPIEKHVYERHCFKCKKTYANVLMLMNHIRKTHAHFRKDENDPNFDP